MLGLLSLAAARGRSSGAAAPKRPNILLIFTDDHSYRTISAYPEAYSWCRTPNIDNLAPQRRALRGGL